MTKKWHSTYGIDHVELARALAELAEPETDPDYSCWTTCPSCRRCPGPTDEVVAIVIPPKRRSARRR